MNISKKALFTTIIISLFFSSFAFIPLKVTHADDPTSIFPLVKCGRQDGEYTHECGFKDALILIDTLLNLMLYIGILLTVILLVYSGFKYVTAGDSPGQLKQVKDMLMTIGIGFIIMLGAYLAINTVVDLLIDKSVIKNPLENGIPLE